jgi:plasmid stabilization system protein ParE
VGNKSAYSIVLSVRAEKEILAAFDWYEAQQTGLGTRFVGNVLTRINDVEKNPELFSFRHKSYREANVSPFPFTVIFRVNRRKAIVRIVSVFHSAQNPNRKY